MIWLGPGQASGSASLQYRRGAVGCLFSDRAFAEREQINVERGGLQLPHTLIPSIRPSAHEKETVDRRHRSTFKVTKQDKVQSRLLAATTQGAKIFFAMNVSPTLRQAWLRE